MLAEYGGFNEAMKKDAAAPAGTREAVEQAGELVARLLAGETE